MSTKTYQQPVQSDVDTEDFDTEEGSYTPPIPIQRTSRNQPPVAPPPTQTSGRDTELGRKRRFVSQPVGFGLLGIGIVIACLVIWSQILVPAWGWSQDQWHYGDSRITQMDANVGHGGESHFIATFSHSDVVIIEISLSNPTHNHIYTLTGFYGETSTPVIDLSVQDVNHDGQPDLIVRIEGTTFETILYNTGSAFSVNEGQP